MNAQVIFNVNSKIKAAAMRRAKREGAPFAAFLKSATKAFAEGKVGMQIAVKEEFNAKTARIIRQALKDWDQGKNISPAFTSAKEIEAYLRRKRL